MRKLSFIFIFFIINYLAFGQIKSNKEEADGYVLEAIKLMDNGDPEKAILLIEKALKLSPKNSIYLYEMGYAYYMKKDYKKAKDIFEDLADSDDAQDLHYKMLGNSLDLLGKPEKAIAAYKKGIKKFPNSGKIYLELGIMSMSKKEYNEALDYWEKGIEVEPAHPSNYYWATKLFANSNEKIWALLYGELFMNLERGSKRTEEISAILFDVYKNTVTAKSDTSMSVDLTKRGTTIKISVDDIKDIEKKLSSKRLLPFEGTYTMAFAPGSIALKSGTSITGIYQTQKMLLEFWYNNFKNNEAYPNVLLDYKKQILDAGHLEAYSYWIHSKGSDKEFEEWYNKNESLFKSFVKWFTANPLKLSLEHRLYRLQY